MLNLIIHLIGVFFIVFKYLLKRFRIIHSIFTIHFQIPYFPEYKSTPKLWPWNFDFKIFRPIIVLYIGTGKSSHETYHLRFELFIIQSLKIISMIYEPSKHPWCSFSKKYIVNFTSHIDRPGIFDFCTA